MTLPGSPTATLYIWCRIQNQIFISISECHWSQRLSIGIFSMCQKCGPRFLTRFYVCQVFFQRRNTRREGGKSPVSSREEWCRSVRSLPAHSRWRHPGGGTDSPGEKLNRLSRDQWGLRGFCQSCQSFSRKLVIDKTNISYWGWIFKYPSVRWSVSSLVCRAAQPSERVQAVCWTDRRLSVCCSLAG